MLPGWFRGSWVDGVGFVETLGPRPASQVTHWLIHGERAWRRKLGAKNWRLAVRLAKRCIETQGVGQ